MHDAGGLWVLSRFADVWDAARDTATYSSARGLTMTDGETELDLVGDFAPHGHARPAGPHGRSAGWSPAGSRLGRSASWSRRSGRSCAPASHRSPTTARPTSSPTCSSRCRAWSSRTTSACPTRTVPASTAGPRRIVAATARGGSFVAAGRGGRDARATSPHLIARRRAEPGEDTISQLVARPAGRRERPADPRLRLHHGRRRQRHDDRACSAAALQLLTEHRDQRQKLVDDPDLVPDAVEELLRLSEPGAGPRAHHDP